MKNAKNKKETQKYIRLSNGYYLNDSSLLICQYDFTLQIGQSKHNFGNKYILYYFW